MRNEGLNDLRMKFYGCEALPHHDAASFLLQRMPGLGCRFLDIMGRQPHPDPVRCIDPGGESLGGLFIEHERLRCDGRTLYHISKGILPPDVKGRASFSFEQTPRSVMFTQRVGRGPASPEQIGASLLEFTNFLYGHMRPRFGLIDELGIQDIASPDEIAGGHMDYLFWSTLFGPDLVAKLGVDFLEDAPVEWVVRMDDGGRLLVACADYLQWWEAEDHPAVAYFRQRFPEIRKYVAELD